MKTKNFEIIERQTQNPFEFESNWLNVYHDMSNHYITEYDSNDFSPIFESISKYATQKEKQRFLNGHLKLSDYKEILNNYYINNITDLYSYALDFLADNELENLKDIENYSFENLLILPLYKFEHSGVTFNISGFSCQWDSGQVGFITVSFEDYKKYNCIHANGNTWKESAKTIVNQMLDQFTKYCNGHVEYYEICGVDVDYNIDVTFETLEDAQKYIDTNF